ncbi:MAG: hypothetical protein AAGB18_04200 [Pseudomonadota bacterium]
MTADEGIRDEDLTAYLDGEADRDMSARVERALASDPALAARLAALNIDRAALARDAEHLLSAAPHSPSLAANSARQIRVLALAATILLGAVLGAGTLLLVGPMTGLQEWRDFAAAYHRLYVAETLAPLPVAPEARSVELERVGTAVGRQLKPAAGHPVLTLRRAQILGHDTRAIAHLAYSSKDGVPIALCVVAITGTAHSLVMGDRAGISTAEWADGTHQFILIGAVPETDLRAAARYFIEAV